MSLSLQVYLHWGHSSCWRPSSKRGCCLSEHWQTVCTSAGLWLGKKLPSISLTKIFNQVWALFYRILQLAWSDSSEGIVC
jgi:hypothetical protein